MKRLPLDAREAFFLSQVDGVLTVEELAEIVGIDLEHALEAADRLVDLGAVRQASPPAREHRAGRGHVAIERRHSRAPADPRMERDSIRPPSSGPSLQPGVTAEKRSLRPGKPPTPPRHPTPRPEARRSRKSVQAQSAAAAPVEKASARPSAATTIRPKRLSAERRASTTHKAARASKAMPKVAAAPAMSAASSTTMPERMRQLRAAAAEMKVHANVELLVKAAEDALRARDVVTAANNYRLALSYREDPLLREKYEDADARARTLRFEKNLVPARAAERAERWAEAAVFLVRAYEARPDADIAARAGNALLLSGGDLGRAALLLEQAIALDAKNVSHHITLAQIHLAANRLASAEAASAAALALAPKDARATELAATIAKAAKGTLEGRARPEDRR